MIEVNNSDKKFQYCLSCFSSKDVKTIRVEQPSGNGTLINLCNNCCDDLIVAILDKQNENEETSFTKTISYGNENLSIRKKEL